MAGLQYCRCAHLYSAYKHVVALLRLRLSLSLHTKADVGDDVSQLVRVVCCLATEVVVAVIRLL